MKEPKKVILMRIQKQDQKIAKMERQIVKLQSYIFQFKESLKKKADKEKKTIDNSFDEEKMEKQLAIQLESAKTALKNQQNGLKNLQKRGQATKYTTDNLLELEDKIRVKENEVKKLQEQIRSMQGTKRKQQKLIEKLQKKEDGDKLMKLADETRKQKEILADLKERNSAIVESINKKEKLIEEMVIKYADKCKQIGQNPANFQEFKSNRRQKMVRQSAEEKKSKLKRGHTSIRQIINSEVRVQDLESSYKSVNELQLKKQVAETSLKITRKKYDKEMEQLAHKIQLLKKENQTLSEKLLQKKKQKEMVSTKIQIQPVRNNSRIHRLEPIKK